MMRVAVVVSGYGSLDGAEIFETVFTIMVPNLKQIFYNNIF